MASLDDNNPNRLHNRTIPVDENDNPVSVGYAQKPDGTFVPIKHDNEGRPEVVVDGIATPFVDSNGNPSSAVVDAQRHLQTDVVGPLPTGDNKIGRVSPAANTPIFEFMHRNITSSEAETQVPSTQVGINLTGYREMIVDVKLEGLGAYVVLVPLVWNPLNEVYQIGESRRFTRNERAVIEVYGAEDIYLLPSEVSGIVNVVVAGY